MTFLKEPYTVVDTTVSADTDWLDSGSSKAFPSTANFGLVFVTPHVDGGGGSDTVFSARAGGREVRMTSASTDGSSAAMSGCQAWVPLVSGRFDYKIVLGSGISNASLKIEAIGYQ